MYPTRRSSVLIINKKHRKEREENENCKNIDSVKNSSPEIICD